LNQEKGARQFIDKGYGPMLRIDIDPKKIDNQINGDEAIEHAWFDQSIVDGDKPFVFNSVTKHDARDIARNYLARIFYVMGKDYLEVG